MAQNDRMKNAVLENVRINFRNFNGSKGVYNDEGDRNFAVFLDDDVAEAMLTQGWAVKRLKPRDDDDGDGQAFLKVKVSYKVRPPRVVLVTSRGKNALNEDMVGTLDWAEIANVDMILAPSRWSNARGESGTSAYLRSIFVTIVEDELDLKYADVDDLDNQSTQYNIHDEDSF